MIPRIILGSKYFQPHKLSVLERSLMVPYFAINSLIDPTRADMVAGLGDTTADLKLKKIYNVMKVSETGRIILNNKPIISEETLNVNYLRNLPIGSFGREYMSFMDNNSFVADERPPVKFILDEDLAYIMLRYRQIHDFWHVICGISSVDVSAEIALKWFEWIKTGFPVCGMSALAGPIRLTSGIHEERHKLLTVYIPWAVKSAISSGDLMSYIYENKFEYPLAAVRQELGIIPAPV